MRRSPMILLQNQAGDLVGQEQLNCCRKKTLVKVKKKKTQSKELRKNMPKDTPFYN